MVRFIKKYSSHFQYWIAILLVVITFGTILGTTGINRLNSLPKLSLIDVESKAQIQQMVEKNDRRIDTLDHRVTAIERQLDKQPRSSHPK